MRTNSGHSPNVLSGKSFSNASSVGVSGTMPNNGALSLTPGTSSQAIAEGYHNGSGSVAGDADLVADNIKKDVDLFGVTGTFEGGPTCSGMLNGTRWCDNGNGTVTDMTTGLVWLKKADWGGTRRLYESGDANENAHDRASLLKDGARGANLSDGSVEGDWRLPTKSELKGLANGTEAVRSNNMRAFTGVQSYLYWSSSTYMGLTPFGWDVNLLDGYVYFGSKTSTDYVWPVRGGQ